MDYLVFWASSLEAEVSIGSKILNDFKSLDWPRCLLPRNTVLFCISTMNFPCGSDAQESACNVEDPDSIPGSGRSPGERNGCPSSILA